MNSRFTYFYTTKDPLPNAQGVHRLNRGVVT